LATRRVRDPEAFGRTAAEACRRLLGRDALNVDWPASRSRRSVRVEFADGSVIATRHKRRERSRLEAYVLSTLHEHGAAVPAVLAYDGEWLLQEYIEGVRLPHVLVSGDDARSHALLADVAAGLARIHRIGDETGLVDKMVRLGTTDRWIDELLDTPNRIGMALDVPAPALRLLDISTPQESSNFGDGARESLHE
jgi:streptomycin 6-kinase